MPLRAARLIFVVTFTLFDVSYAVYNHYSGIKTNTGYVYTIFVKFILV